MPAYVLSCAVALARNSNALPALTTPLRTGSPEPRSTCSGSPVSTDSSSTATVSTMRPSTGTTSPGPTTRRSSTATSVSGITVTSEPIRLRANRGACSSSARKSCDARRSAAASSARPPASITAINAPARYSPTSSVPTSDSTAIRSTPARPRRSAASTHSTAGTSATEVPAIQHASASGTPTGQPCEAACGQRADREHHQSRLDIRTPWGHPCTDRIERHRRS